LEKERGYLVTRGIILIVWSLFFAKLFLLVFQLVLAEFALKQKQNEEIQKKAKRSEGTEPDFHSLRGQVTREISWFHRIEAGATHRKEEKSQKRRK
jgi:hypothetical protein